MMLAETVLDLAIMQEALNMYVQAGQKRLGKIKSGSRNAMNGVKHYKLKITTAQNILNTISNF